MVNPMQIMQLKNLLDKFRTNHPKVPLFMQAAAKSIDAGSIIEITVTNSSGKTLCTNMRVTQEDLDMIQSLKEMSAKQN